MIDRSNQAQGKDDMSDPEVSKAYRALSTESTSAELDRKVLEKASGAAAAGLRRYYRMKPLAWAAILVLTVGIVLELQRSIDPLPDGTVDENDMAESLDSNATPAQIENLPGAGRTRAKQSEAPAASPAALRRSTAQDADGEGAAADRGGGAGSHSSSQALSSQALPAKTSSSTTGEADPPAPAASDSIRAITEAIENAEARKDERDNGWSRSPGFAPQSLSRGDRITTSSRHCDEADTADPSSWYRCILELEEQGKSEQAIEERARLLTEFPEFELR